MALSAGAFYIPKKNINKPLGEDAYFINHVGRTIGVADGVGGWAKEGIDSGIFARELMANAERKVDNQPPGVASNPMDVLKFAYLNTKAQGASTACIITFSVNYFNAVNIGDSGFLVIRNGVTIFHSPVQQFEFNFPYQLSKTGDGPELAEKFHVVDVKPGDLIVLGTDGLFDNVFDSEIEEIVTTSLDNDDTPHQMARNIAELALQKSNDIDTITPFSEAANDVGWDFTGGKYDDITVVVAYIEFPDSEDFNVLF